MEFRKDGTMRITAKKDGQEVTVNAVYKVEGEKIQFTLKEDGKEEKKPPLTIKKISDQELVLEAKDGLTTFELKRMK
jgi:uncharacterized protein (TIGR03066 family)